MRPGKKPLRLDSKPQGLEEQLITDGTGNPDPNPKHLVDRSL